MVRKHTKDREHLSRIAKLFQRHLGSLHRKGKRSLQALVDLSASHPALLFISLSLVALILRLPYIAEHEFPTLFYDELLYVFKARNFYTYGSYYEPPGVPELRYNYNPLYSLFISPAFLFTQHPQVAYQIIQLINSLLLVSMIYPVYKISELEFPSKKWLIAAAISIWSVPFCYSYSAMTEALFIPLFLWTIYAYYLCWQRSTIGRRMLLAFLVAALPLTRAAGLGMLAVAALFIIISSSDSRAPFRLSNLRQFFERLPIIIPPALCWFVWLEINSGRQSGATGSDYVGRALSVLQSPGAYLSYLKTWLNQISYINLATYNLLVVLIFFIVVRYPLGGKQTAGSGSTSWVNPRIFVLVASAAMIFPSTLHMFQGLQVRENTRYYMYGRYVDMLVPVLLIYALGVIQPFRLRECARRVSWAAAAALVSLAVLYLPITFEIEGTRILNMGAAWYVTAIENAPTWLVVLLSACPAAMLVIGNRRALGVLGAVALLLFNVYNTMVVIEKLRKYEGREQGIIEVLERVRKEQGILYYSKREISHKVIFRARFYLHEKCREYERGTELGPHDFLTYEGNILSAREYELSRESHTFFAADPNPIQVCDGSGRGRTTLSWSLSGRGRVEARIGSYDGKVVARGGRRGKRTTGKWVKNGTLFYLQDTSGTGPPTPEDTLGLLIVNLTTAGCAGDS